MSKADELRKKGQVDKTTINRGDFRQAQREQERKLATAARSKMDLNMILEKMIIIKRSLQAIKYPFKAIGSEITRATARVRKEEGDVAAVRSNLEKSQKDFDASSNLSKEELEKLKGEIQKLKDEIKEKEKKLEELEKKSRESEGKKTKIDSTKQQSIFRQREVLAREEKEIEIAKSTLTALLNKQMAMKKEIANFRSELIILENRYKDHERRSQS